MRKTLAALAAASVLASGFIPALAAAETYTIDPNHSQVGFVIRHFVSRVPGRFTSFRGEIVVDPAQPTASKVTAEIDTASINTGNDKRDAHLKSADFFDAEKYPKITFVSTGATSTSKDHVAVAGNLTVHGVTKPVTLDVAILGFLGKKAGFEAKTTINRKDFGITWNQVLDAGGAMLGEDVEITLLIEANKVEPPKAEPKKADKPAGTK